MARNIKIGDIDNLYYWTNRTGVPINPHRMSKKFSSVCTIEPEELPKELRPLYSAPFFDDKGCVCQIQDDYTCYLAEYNGLYGVAVTYLVWLPECRFLRRSFEDDLKGVEIAYNELKETLPDGSILIKEIKEDDHAYLIVFTPAQYVDRPRIGKIFQMMNKIFDRLAGLEGIDHSDIDRWVAEWKGYATY